MLTVNKIDFSFNSYLNDGEAYSITGNTEELGNYNNDKAIRMDILEETNWF